MSNSHTVIRLKNSTTQGIVDDLVNAGFMEWRDGTEGEPGEHVPVNCDVHLMPVNYDPMPEYDEDTGELISEGEDQGPHGDLRVKSDDTRLSNIPDVGYIMTNGTERVAEPNTPWHKWAGE